jgi:nucleotide-binding universal stress UspA family protein
MFKKILLPIDMSDRHDQALRVAADLARARGGVGEVILLHVVETIAGLPEEEEFYGRLQRVARKHLEGMSRSLADQKVPARLEVVLGNRGREIVRQAREGNVDLVILTVPRIDAGNVSAGLGSLGYQVGLFAPCPVLLVK